jgi:4-hydroxybenzoate polyprenyltransferase
MRIPNCAVRAASLLAASALWIAAMSFFWIGFLCQLAHTPFSFAAGLLLCLVTFAVYAYDHVSGSPEDLQNNPARAALARYHLKEMAIGAYIAALILCYVWMPDKLLAVLVPGVAGGLYTARIGHIRPKDLPGMKTLIVASSTAICRAGLIDGAAWLYVLVFLMMIIDTVLCDLRDVPGDKAAGVRTIPALIGRQRTLYMLAAVASILYFLSPAVAISGGLLILFFRKERHSLCYDLLVDGWAAFIWASSLLEYSLIAR